MIGGSFDILNFNVSYFQIYQLIFGVDKRLKTEFMNELLAYRL